MKHTNNRELFVFRSFYLTIAFFVFFIFSIGLTGQVSDTLELSRYEMADSLRWGNISKNVFSISVAPRWKNDNSGLWYTEHTRQGHRYQHINYETMEISEIFNHEVLSEKLNEFLDIKKDPKALLLSDINFLSKSVISFNCSNRKFKYDISASRLTEKEKKESSNPLEVASPDGQWIAFVKDHNLYVKARDRDEEIQLSKAGKKNYEYGSYYRWFDGMEGEQGERPERVSITWSPDSKKIFCFIVDLRNASKMFMLDNSIDTLYRPRLLSYYRASPGDTNIVYYQPVVFDLENRTEAEIEIESVPHFMGIYPTWSESGDKLYLTHWKRGFQQVSISDVDLKDGRLEELYTERSDIGIEYSSFVPYYSDENNGFIFTSEKSGWKQLYKLDLANNQVSTITNGKYFIDEVEHIDEENKKIYFTAAGKDPDQNPYHNYLYSVDLDGSNFQQLTLEEGHHDINLSPDGKYFMDNYSRFDLPTTSILRETATGNSKVLVSTADTKYLDDIAWQTPQDFKVKAGDGVTDIYGVFYKPTDLDPNRSYPIIDATYTGPHTNRFPSSYYSTIRSNALALAELGFVVIRVDGRGSNNRSRAFRSYSYKNLGGGLDDHVVAIEALGKIYPWIDTTRVGIFGHSAGGYDAGRALLAYPDFYKVGVASSADHDHRMEKAWWPEMYMGWPVGDEYQDQSNVTNAKNLKGKLLLVHGALDDNVNISATMKLSEALIKADKEFDLLIFPSQKHGYRGKYAEYFAKKRWNYFVEHLLQKTPRWDFRLK